MKISKIKMNYFFRNSPWRKFCKKIEASRAAASRRQICVFTPTGRRSGGGA
jgi:hypothetical protein